MRHLCEPVHPLIIDGCSYVQTPHICPIDHDFNSLCIDRLRFQEKIDKVKEEVKNPCADFLTAEIKYKQMKKDIVKAKKARDTEEEEKDTNDAEQDDTVPQQGAEKRRRKKSKPVPEPVSKPKASAKSKTDASKKRKRASVQQGSFRIPSRSVWQVASIVRKTQHI